MWPEIRDYRQTSEMSTDDLVAGYGLAGRLRRFEPDGSLDGALRLWMFRARKELEARGKLELIRDWLPVYFDPTKRNPVFGPGAALAGAAVDGNGAPPVHAVPPSDRGLIAQWP